MPILNERFAKCDPCISNTICRHQLEFSMTASSVSLVMLSTSTANSVLNSSTEWLIPADIVVQESPQETTTRIHIQRLWWPRPSNSKLFRILIKKNFKTCKWHWIHWKHIYKMLSQEKDLPCFLIVVVPEQQYNKRNRIIKTGI